MSPLMELTEVTALINALAENLHLFRKQITSAARGKFALDCFTVGSSLRHVSRIASLNDDNAKSQSP